MKETLELKQEVYKVLDITIKLYNELNKMCFENKELNYNKTLEFILKQITILKNGYISLDQDKPYLEYNDTKTNLFRIYKFINQLYKLNPNRYKTLNNIAKRIIDTFTDTNFQEDIDDDFYHKNLGPDYNTFIYKEEIEFNTFF